jgi:hypothetical protein
MKSIACDIVVCSAGGLGSPEVIKQFQRIAGIDNINTGHWLIDHPMGFVGKIKVKNTFDIRGLIAEPYTKKYQLRRGFAVHDPESGLNHCIYLRPSGTLKDSLDLYEAKKQIATYRASKNYFKLAKLLANQDIFIEAVALKLGIQIPTKYYSILVVSEQRPDFCRFVEQEGKNRAINWNVSPKEVRSISRSLDIFLQHFSKDLEEINMASDIGTRLWSAAHHSGTCRMSATPTLGVVDIDLKVHGFENLYICDGSVIPNSGYSNTGATIIALANRLHSHLAKS